MRIYTYVCVCVGIMYGRLLIVLRGYGFEKANLSLRALGPCQLYQPVSYAICYRTTAACAHTCGIKHQPLPFHEQSFIPG